MKFFRFFVLLITSALQTLLLRINFYIFPANKKFKFVNNGFFSLFMIVCFFISFVILKKLISYAFFYFFDEDEDNSAQIMENCFSDSLILLLVYNFVCLIFHQNYPILFAQFIVGESFTGEGALNYLILGVIAILQSIYINITYISKFNIKCSLVSYLQRQFLLSILMLIPYTRNFLVYFGRC